MPFSFVSGLASAVGFSNVTSQGMYWWQVQYIFVAIVSLAHLIGVLCFVPDTPHWYYETNQLLQGNRVVRDFYSNPFDVIGTKAFIKQEAMTVMHSRYSLAIGAVVSFTMATCGINYSFFFEENVMTQSTHLADSSLTLILMCVGVCLSLVVSLISNSSSHIGIPRKLAITVGLVCMGISQTIGGCIIQYKSDSPWSVIVLLLILASFELGLGTFYWLYLPELTKVRRISLSVSVYWGVEVLMSLIYYLKNYYFTTYSLYYAHGLLNILLAVVIHCIGVETLGSSWRKLKMHLEEVN